MGMGAGLLGPVRTRIARQRQDVAGRIQAAIGTHRHQRDRAAGIVGHDQEAAGRVEGLMHAVGAAGGGAPQGRRVPSGAAAKALAASPSPCTV